MFCHNNVRESPADHACFKRVPLRIRRTHLQRLNEKNSSKYSRRSFAIRLSSRRATLAHADRVLVLLLNKLETANTELSLALKQAVIDEIVKRRTYLSTLLQYLLNANYDYKLEKLLKVPCLSDKEKVASFRNIVEQMGTSETDTLGCSNASSTEDPPPDEVSLSFENIFSIPLINHGNGVDRSAQQKATIVKIRQ